MYSVPYIVLYYEEHSAIRKGKERYVLPKKQRVGNILLPFLPVLNDDSKQLFQ